MEELLDINKKVLQQGDKIVFEHDAYIEQGYISHFTQGSVVIKKNLEDKWRRRQISKHQTKVKIYKI